MSNTVNGIEDATGYPVLVVSDKIETYLYNPHNDTLMARTTSGFLYTLDVISSKEVPKKDGMKQVFTFFIGESMGTVTFNKPNPPQPTSSNDKE